MFEIDLPWWQDLLLPLYVVMLLFGVGAIVGFILTYAVIGALQRGGKATSILTVDRIGISVGGAIVGGIVQLAGWYFGVWPWFVG